MEKTYSKDGEIATKIKENINPKKEPGFDLIIEQIDTKLIPQESYS